jgi:hypothetical protein
MLHSIKTRYHFIIEILQGERMLGSSVIVKRETPIRMVRALGLLQSEVNKTKL